MQPCSRVLRTRCWRSCLSLRCVCRCNAPSLTNQVKMPLRRWRSRVTRPQVMHRPTHLFLKGLMTMSRAIPIAPRLSTPFAPGAELFRVNLPLCSRRCGDHAAGHWQGEGLRQHLLRALADVADYDYKTNKEAYVITLNWHVDGPVTIPANKKVVIDLNGKQFKTKMMHWSWRAGLRLCRTARVAVELRVCTVPPLLFTLMPSLLF